MFAELDKRLQYGPGMRAQRLVEAALLVGALFTRDLRWAYAVLALTALQALSPRLVPVALVVSAFKRAPTQYRLGDLYFDLAATRGACAISLFVQAAGIWLVRSGHDVVGYASLTMPAASFVLAPTVGFCCGCSVYVGLRSLLARAGIATRYAHDACDIDIDGSEAPSHQ
jgi:hypothetical protein